MWTREAKREYQRKWKAARRAAWLAGKSCEWCGSTTELEVDHIDPARKVSHKVWSWAKSRRDAELAKCRVLCKPCHLRRTHPGLEHEGQHGRPGMYTNHGCRCGPCTAAHSAASAAYRAKRRPAVA